MNATIRSICTLAEAVANYTMARAAVLFVPLKKRKFFCVSMTGNNYGDNIKALSDYIQTNLSHSKVVWAFTDSYYEKATCSCKKVKLYTFQYYFEILTSKYVLSNCTFNHKMLMKRKGQIYLQTWHGTTLKKIGHDISRDENKSLPKRIEGFLGLDPIGYDNSLIDVFVSGSKYMSQIYRDTFWYKGELSEVGTPRNDIFFQEHPEVIEKVKKEYGISADTGIILYAPTFRTDSLFECYDIDLDGLKKAWEHKTGKQYKVLVRLHPILLSNNKLFSKLIGNSVINASYYPDMQELLYSTDLLITDYSSSMFDFMYTYRPVVIYAKDRKEYVRGMYFELEELPFILVNDNEEIMEKIESYDARSYTQEINQFMNRIGSVETGNATKNTVKLLLQK